MKNVLLAAAFMSVSFFASAAEPFKGVDYSGVYDCKGIDDKEGPYTATVTLTLQPAHSTGAYGAYAFLMQVPSFGTYVGQAAGKDRTLAIHFALTDPATLDFGTGIADVSVQKGKTRFRKFYYQPEFKGGNHGTEDCIRR